MSLQFILGNSGAGKSHYIFEKIINESLKNPDGQYFVIVPEQFTMQTQKDLVSLHPRHGIMNIDVLSFERLAHRVFDEIGDEHRQILEDTGKNLILRKIAEEKKEELTLLAGNLKKLGYISEMKSLISEFTQYRLTPEALRRVCEQNRERNPQLYFKLKDMLLVYESFRAYLDEGAYMTSEELLDALEKRVAQSRAVQNSVIALDGFTGFTPVQMNLLRTLLSLASEVFVTLTMDGNGNPYQPDREYQLFHLTKKTIAGVSALAHDARVPVLPPVMLNDAEQYRYRHAPELNFLERHIFRYDRSVWERETEEIRLCAAPSPWQEAEHVAREIQRLVRDEKLRYRELAVVTGDLEVYGPLMRQAFESYGIPGFIDQKQNVLKNPFVEFLRAIPAVIQENFTYEAMFRLLRSGMTRVDSEEVDELENYVVARGIRGWSGWSRQWKRPLRGMTEEELTHVNALRELALEGLAELRGEFKRKETDARTLTRALYDYLVRMEIQKQLKRYEEQFEAQGEHDLAKEYGRIYGMVMGLFDKIVLLLDTCRMELSEYAELLDAGLCELKMGLIPAGTDQVLVGDMERSRLKDVRILFFMGVNEGSVPRGKNRGGILSELDRELLAEQKVELSPTSRQETYIQKFYMYLTLTKPSQRLIVSYSLTDAGGGALRPSWLVAQLQQLFPRLQALGDEEPVSAAGSVREAAEALQALREGQESEGQRALLRWYFQQPDWTGELQRLLDAVCFRREESGIGRAAARMLYGKILEGSITRLEQFASCAYAHFLQYGLALREREVFGLETVDLGNVFHDALKLFSDKVQFGGYGWFQVPDEKRVQWMEEALEGAMELHTDRVFSDRAKDQYAWERVKRIGQRTAWAILKQLEQGAFLPEQTEVSFRELEQLSSVSMSLSEEERMRLRGRIDRIDICRKDGKVYVRVLDYKSGMTRFDLTSIYYGLQLQLVVYLSAAVELEKRAGKGEVHPAGMFYYHIDDPMLDYDADTDPARRIFGELAWNGLANADRRIVELMDRDVVQGSDILPLRLKKDGDYTAASSVANEERIGKLMAHVQKLIRDYGKRILDGDIRMDPYELGDRDACAYCAYHSVCGFDRKVPGCEKRQLYSLEKDEIWKRIEE